MDDHSHTHLCDTQQALRGSAISVTSGVTRDVHFQKRVRGKRESERSGTEQKHTVRWVVAGAVCHAQNDTAVQQSKDSNWATVLSQQH